MLFKRFRHRGILLLFTAAVILLSGCASINVIHQFSAPANQSLHIKEVTLKLNSGGATAIVLVDGVLMEKGVWTLSVDDGGEDPIYITPKKLTTPQRVKARLVLPIKEIKQLDINLYVSGKVVDQKQIVYSSSR